MAEIFFRLIPFVLAVLPAVIILFYFLVAVNVSVDHETLWACVGFGACVAFPCIVAVNLLAPHIDVPPDPYSLSAKKAFVEAAIPEEIFKLVALVSVCWASLKTMSARQIFICSIGCACGFAGLENLFYVLEGVSSEEGRNWLAVGLMRSVSAVPGHAFVGAVMGYCVYRAIHSRGSNLVWWLASLVGPMLLHGAYNFCLFANDYLEAGTNGAQSDAAGVMIGLFILVVIVEGLIAHAFLDLVLEEGEVRHRKLCNGGFIQVLSKVSYHPMLWGLIGGLCILVSLLLAIGVFVLDENAKRLFAIGFAAFAFLHGIAFSGLARVLRKRRREARFARPDMSRIIRSGVRARAGWQGR